MKNLVVCRGLNESNVMIGPCDYFGSLENIKNKWYSIKIHNNVIAFYRVKPNITNLMVHTNPNPVYSIKGNWISHSLENSEHSLFPKPGILTLDTTERVVNLPSFDAVKYELFGARMVKNDDSFQMLQENTFTSKEAYDDLRVISYKFAQNYTNYQFQTNGLFLERHQFIQSMTPLNENASGFVLLAKVENDIYTIVPVCIPFGYTLIVGPDCIHGDATLSGYYAMCMTSDHVSMATSDTVFLRNLNNETILFECNSTSKCDDIPFDITCHNQIYNYPNFPISSIFNPFAKGYWKYITS
jgi:hypothetical protein